MFPAPALAWSLSFHCDILVFTASLGGSCTPVLQSLGSETKLNLNQCHKWLHCQKQSKKLNSISARMHIIGVTAWSLELPVKSCSLVLKNQEQ